ncbi:accessory Sec system glycosyltransferase Asp1 [Lactobacillus sp. ESL0731]|uniref:accessory Sec system glycosyltransferase Asp1 n=1 Tax=unclassified Lactobacillus TaxID=2620435 RepID=UPI0023F90131|nr:MULTISPECIES: accessory Sec system glycosyltransferase Asp1 [unclassified Lactobacillus]WEV51821.1 accessory Sec system glycosyltransferase Asp1 [Lactobacillus sp. ESL0700]WEV62950.1 accessory Sec system glycosyltransferase Asp1 [Lactobacillus sp. ESL0731]
MLTLIPDLHTKSKFYQENTMLSLSARLQEENVDNQLLILSDDTDQFLSDFMGVKSRIIYLFDEIRAIKTDGSPLTISDLNIPDKYKTKTLIYLNETVVHVYDGPQLIMSVLVGNSGQLKSVTYYKDTGQIVDIYDLRGFRNSRSVYDQDDNLIEKQWFNATSDLVMTQHEDLTVTIPWRQQSRFQKNSYTNLAEVEYEFALPHLTGRQQVLIEPSKSSFDFRHFMLQAEVYYYFTNETQIADIDQYNLVPTDQYLFQNETLTQLFKNKVKQSGISFMPVWQIIPPYFSEFSLGTSMEQEQQIIYWHVGDIGGDDLTACFNQLIEVLKENEDLKVVADANYDAALYFKSVSADFIAQLKEQVGDLDDVTSLDELVDIDTDDFDVDQLDALNRFSCPENLLYEEKLQILNQAHIYIDTGLMTDYDMQLEAVKIGIPQIVYQANGLVKEGKNGFLIKEQDAIKEPVDVFLTNLDRWNIAVVENVRLIQRMSLRKIISKWKRVLQG